MMMDRRHTENPLSAGLFKVGHLDDNREYLDQIDQSDNHDKQRHLHHIGCRDHKSAERQ